MVPWYIYIIFKDIKSKRSHNYSVAAGSETFVRIRSGTDINVSDPDSNPDPRIRIRIRIGFLHSDPDSNLDPNPKLSVSTPVLA